MNNRRLFLTREALIRWSSSLQDVAGAEEANPIKCWGKSLKVLKHRNTASTLTRVSHVLGVETPLEEEHHCLSAMSLGDSESRIMGLT